MFSDLDLDDKFCFLKNGMVLVISSLEKTRCFPHLGTDANLFFVVSQKVILREM